MDEFNRYFDELSSALNCPAQIRIRLVERTKQMADDFRSGNPTASWEDTRKFLGEPTELAWTMLECEDQNVIRHYQETRKKFRIILMALLLSALTIVSCAFIYVCWFKSQPISVQVQERIVIRGDLTYVGDQFKEEP